MKDFFKGIRDPLCKFITKNPKNSLIGIVVIIVVFYIYFW